MIREENKVREFNDSVKEMTDISAQIIQYGNKLISDFINSATVYSQCIGAQYKSSGVFD